ncbi:MAG TPA: serine hydrolase [Candidatus Nanoarchaeia archaeon]|nr:serine hydrolase [Candidatus Nanoarchaeia archaeon]
MTLPAALGFFVTSIVANFFSANIAVPPADASNLPTGGRVLGAIEQAYSLPSDDYVAFYPENNLPPIADKIVIPKPGAISALTVVASSSMAIDRDSGAVLWTANADEARPIASITKLMTALVFLNSNPNMDKIYELQKEDVRVGGKSYIYPGDQVRTRDLFYLTLVGSDNTAAVALARSLGLTEAEFVEKMNVQAKQFGLLDTKFEDISGLSDGNVSTARDVLTLAKKCLAKQQIRDTTIEQNYEFSTQEGRAVQVRSTDALLSVFPVDGINIVGGKTGHTDKAGYCFVGEFVNQAGRKIISVVMGADSDQDRFGQTKKLVKWAYDSFSWQ